MLPVFLSHKCDCRRQPFAVRHDHAAGLICHLFTGYMSTNVSAVWEHCRYIYSCPVSSKKNLQIHPSSFDRTKLITWLHRHDTDSPLILRTKLFYIWDCTTGVYVGAGEDGFHTNLKLCTFYYFIISLYFLLLWYGSMWSDANKLIDWLI